jgi:glycosyltransferase involved in cell wall biosynthesis
MEYLGNNKEVNKINPLVSVCVQVYNNEEFIEQCLTSILNQKTNFNYEIIVGEDDSSDTTRAICKRIAESNQDKIRLFLRREEDKIYHNGRRTSRYNYISNIESARGKYIALCDGDDYWLTEFKIQKQYDLIEQSPGVIAIHHWQKYSYYNGNHWEEVDAPTGIGYGYCQDELSSVEKIFKNELRIKARTVFFRNVITRGFLPDWFKKVAFADLSISFLLGEHGNFLFIDECLAVYRQSQSERLSTSGITELGLVRFRVEHYKNYIEIWDYADKHFRYKYHNEASKTVKEYLKIIIDNSPTSIFSIIEVLKYSLLDRRMPINRIIFSSMWVFIFFTKKIGSRVKRKLKFS